MPDAQVTKRIGCYTLHETVSTSSQATVYKAKHDDFPEFVALKVLNSALSSDLITKRFQREGMTATSLQHENIVPVLDVGKSGDDLYYAMAFVDGFTLDEVREEIWNPDPSSDSSLKELAEQLQQLHNVIQFARDILAALEYIHQQGVIHRDITPSNILVDVDGKPWITDFGIAKLTESVTEKLTMQHAVVGTRRYASPEQLCGGDEEVCGIVAAQSDIYSFGIVLHELLHNQMPFNRSRLIRRRRRPFKIPKRLEDAVLKSCQSDPTERYPTAEQMDRELYACLLEESIDHAQHAKQHERKPFLSPFSFAVLVLVTAITSLAIQLNLNTVRDFTNLVNRLVGKPLQLTPADTFAGDWATETESANLRTTTSTLPVAIRSWGESVAPTSRTPSQLSTPLNSAYRDSSVRRHTPQATAPELTHSRMRTTTGSNCPTGKR